MQIELHRAMNTLKIKSFFVFLIFLQSISTASAAVQCKSLFAPKAKSVQSQANKEKSEQKKQEQEAAIQLQKDIDQPDRFETMRDWGTKLLSDQDPAWKDPEFLNRLHEFAVPGITNYGGKASKLLYEHHDYLNNFFQGDVHSFTSTGTDANNMLFLHAKEGLEEKLGHPAKNMKFITFEGIYGGSYGPILKLMEDRSHHLKSPTYTTNEVLTKERLSELKKIENEALEKIEAQISDNANEVGAIFLESIPAAHGVRIYRTEFLLKLRALTDKYNTPIFADEILTGGGRTGTFWAFQHYKGFVPDLVTFGKGLALSGVFAPRRTKMVKDRYSDRSYQTTTGYGRLKTAYSTTTAVNPLALLQSLQVVKNIWNRRLDLNAAQTGDYLMARAKKGITDKDPEFFNRRHDEYRSPLSGVGLLITNFPSGYALQPGYQGRVLPVLSTTREDVDWALTHKPKNDW